MLASATKLVDGSVASSTVSAIPRFVAGYRAGDTCYRLSLTFRTDGAISCSVRYGGHRPTLLELAALVFINKEDLWSDTPGSRKPRPQWGNSGAAGEWGRRQECV